MKRKYGDGSSWKRLIEKNYRVKQVEEGMLGILEIKKVREPSCKEYDGEELCIAADQYTWIQYFINGKNFAITAMLDGQKKLVQYYIDVAKEYEIDDRGLPYFDDLYLDVVLLPNGKMYVLDEDELEDAYKSGDVTKEEYELAWYTTKWIIDAIKNSEFYWISILEEEIKKLK
ncbi:DUF402 domain-containing protein [Bacillus wiedmannii]|uniref:DUF402 domain-containing protein n=2 Tax=Bacillus wiedmannii TaxID=1890302 RepID=A0A242ZPQ3_9BACI|nr:DUF402 domain-containing protein [Bacillus wiedmannii]KMP75794.1 hypothetical protein TU62_12670 [Bacillus cereus]OUB37443.1 hypothetical protein BK740_31005 [Bacillus thuringiensis serovar argentinensis]MCQ6571005.1 DUF402 domain-containing protein [Bacillus wiedmannii]MCU5574178.1 DUF402 domain-containing protein [Bacillus wiedmannii]MDM5266461.1 DUF402 domain-containing protein [Bacillus wiedmannii]